MLTKVQHSSSSQIRFKFLMIRSSLCNYKRKTKEIKKVTFKNFAPFTRSLSQINNTQVDDDQESDVVMPMYNLIGHSILFKNIWKVITMLQG